MPGAVVDVGAADPRRLDPHQDLAGPRLRVRGRHLLEGGADPDDLESAHPPRLGRARDTTPAPPQPQPRAILRDVNDELSEFFGTINSRTITVRAADGRTMVQTKALHVAAAGIAAVIFAPRLAAAAAVGALVAGVTVSVDDMAEPPGAAEGSAPA